MLFDCRPKVLHKHCLQFLLRVKKAPRETENNAYAKFWGEKQRTLWYVMVFLEWSIVKILEMKRVREGENYFPSALMAVNRTTIKKCNKTPIL